MSVALITHIVMDINSVSENIVYKIYKTFLSSGDQRSVRGGQLHNNIVIYVLYRPPSGKLVESGCTSDGRAKR